MITSSALIFLAREGLTVYSAGKLKPYLEVPDIM
jgi:hypothetical protein